MDENTTRRRVLASLGAGAASLAGCLDDGPGTPTGRSTTAAETHSQSPPPESATATSPPQGSTPTDTPRPPVELTAGEAHITEFGWSVTVHSPSVARMVRDFQVGYSPVRYDPENQFLQFVASTAVESYAAAAVGAKKLGKYTPTQTPHSPDPEDGPTDPRHLNLQLLVDGERMVGTDPFWIDSEDSSRNAQHYAAEVPVAAEPSSVTVVWNRTDYPDVHWSIPASVVDRLSIAPSFSVEAFAVPDTVAADAERVEGTVTVRNDGDVDGRFLAGLRVEDVAPYRYVSLSVPRGETASTSVEIPFPRHTTETVARLEWGDRTIERRVVRKTPTPSPDE